MVQAFEQGMKHRCIAIGTFRLAETFTGIAVIEL
jgi:hypothetical protein